MNTPSPPSKVGSAVVHVCAVAAVDLNDTMAIDGIIPHFYYGSGLIDGIHHRLTAHHTVVLGRRAALSMGKHLPGRHTIVLTGSTPHHRPSGAPAHPLNVSRSALIARSVPKVLALAATLNSGTTLYVVGGRKTLAAFAPHASSVVKFVLQIHLTTPFDHHHHHDTRTTLFPAGAYARLSHATTTHTYDYQPLTASTLPVLCYTPPPSLPLTAIPVAYYTPPGSPIITTIIIRPVDDADLSPIHQLDINIATIRNNHDNFTTLRNQEQPRTTDDDNNDSFTDYPTDDDHDDDHDDESSSQDDPFTDYSTDDDDDDNDSQDEMFKLMLTADATPYDQLTDSFLGLDLCRRDLPPR
jgi:dihydrofolate reductase